MPIISDAAVKQAKLYAVCLIALLAADALWLGYLSGTMYTDVLGPLMADPIRPVPAILFYLLYTAGIVILVLPRARGRDWPLGAIWPGAVFGLCAYGTYDLTTLAVLRVWTWDVTLTDMAWGAFVTAFVSGAGALAEQRLNR